MGELKNKAKTKWLEIVKMKGWKGYTKNEFEAFAMGLEDVEAEITDKQETIDLLLTAVTGLNEYSEELEGKVEQFHKWLDQRSTDMKSVHWLEAKLNLDKFIEVFGEKKNEA